MPEKRKARNSRKAAARPSRKKFPSPSGYVGVRRSRDGKHWAAFVVDPDLICLGSSFNTPRQANMARLKYWEKQATA
jgi:hypothetical protein